MARTRQAPGTRPPLTPFSRGSGSRTVAVFAYRGVSTTEAEVPAIALAEQLDASVSYYSADGGEVVGVEPGRLVQTEVLRPISPTVLLLPGGLGWRGPAETHETLAWITTTATEAGGVLTVSTGSLLLAATGLISGEAAAGHWLGRALLDGLGADASAERVTSIHDNTWVTASGYTAAVAAAKPLADRIQWGRATPSNDT